MVELLGPWETERLRAAGRAAAATLRQVGAQLRVGMSTADVDALVRADTRARGGKPSQLGYKGFPAAVCTSRNAVVCHGVPSASELLEEGDLLSVDVTTELNGFHGDTCATFAVGKATPEALHVLETARRCRDAGVAAVRDGARLGDVAEAVQRVARAAGCAVVRDFGGHGIGRRMHQEPHVPFHGEAGTGRRLRAGQALTIEPMLTLGSAEVEVLADGWTVRTRDGSLAAQFEHTVLVTRSGHELMTV